MAKKNGGQKRLIEIVCPNCGGATSVLDEASFPVYKCHVGHTFSELAFGATYAEYIEGILWEAYRALVENTNFHKMCRERAMRIEDQDRAESCRKQSESLETHSRVLRKMIDDIIFESAKYQKQTNMP